jgi:DnaJ-class molecular chaperone
MQQTDHYGALGLRSSATLAEIKQAYRQLAARYHPDRNDSEQAPQRFRAVQQAYEVLADANARKAYDDNRKRNLLDDPLATARQIWQDYVAQLR